MRLADVDVIAAYPIRPYTEVMDALSKLIADGQFDAEYIIADSEHSQFEIVKHASSVNARAFGGSSGTGWMYGMEALVVTATDRLPPLFVVGNRALDDPGAFGVEHNDAMAVRDMGWLLCWVTTPQEALEHVLIGYRVAEDKHVRMPMATGDGRRVSDPLAAHGEDPVRRGSEEISAALRPGRPATPSRQSDLRRAAGQRGLGHGDQTPELGGGQTRARVITEAYHEFNDSLWQSTTPHLTTSTEFMTDDAEVVLIGLGTVAAPARTAVRRLREKGQKVGYVNLRWFRRFPTVELRECSEPLQGGRGDRSGLSPTGRRTTAAC